LKVIIERLIYWKSFYWKSSHYWKLEVIT